MESCGEKKIKVKTQYDVVIVGAGPAGASAAQGLVKEGYRVLIVEKKKLPRYKICSGLITDRAQDLLEQLYGQISEEILCNPKTLKGTRICMSQDNLMNVPMKSINIMSGVQTLITGLLSSPVRKCGTNIN